MSGVARSRASTSFDFASVSIMVVYVRTFGLTCCKSELDCETLHHVASYTSGLA